MKNISSIIKSLNENQDGTLTGGFLSLSDGRYRIIIDGNNPSGDNPDEQVVWTNVDCTNVKNNEACNNLLCSGSTNSSGAGIQNCLNYRCRTTNSNPSTYTPNK